MANKYKEKRETLSKFDCYCAKCQKPIKKGQVIKFDPVKKEAICCDKKKASEK